MKKKILCLALTLFMAAGASMTAYAKDYQGKDGWEVEFDGKKLNSNFKTTDVSDETANVQPGDSIELKVQLKNSDSGKTDWYMTNEVVQSLEDAKNDASGGAYEYRLTFVNGQNEEKVLYDSAAVGGSNENQNEEGLHQATESLKDYFYLDRIDTGKTGTVHLWIKVEGETQGNGYQQTLAKLQMNFAVEKVAGDGTVRKNTVVRTVKTGDTSKVLLLCTIALISGIVLLIFGIISMKRNRDRGRKKGE